MALRRKQAVGTPLDREELEELLAHLNASIEKLKESMWELDKSTKKAKGVADALNQACARAEASSRRPLMRKGNG